MEVTSRNCEANNNLSLSYSEMKCGKSLNKIKICYLTSNPLPHYLAKFEFSTAQLFIHTSQNNVRTSNVSGRVMK